MIKIWLFVAVVTFGGSLLSGCTDGEMMPEDPGKAEYNLVLPDDLYIDSAQVFFFRNLGHADTLILRETIYDIGTTPKRFEFDLPAGYYNVAFFGNIATDRIVEKPPYSRDSIWFSYQGGIEPPDIFRGVGYLNAGADTTGLSGFVLFVSRVELTLKNIPAGIKRIEAPVLNTSSGIGFKGYLKEEMNPPLTMYLDSIRADSSYTLTMNCFPSGQTPFKSIISVNCYNAADELVFSGNSQPFLMKYGVRMIIACSFDETARTSKNRRIHKPDRENMTLVWSYDEKNM